MAENEVDASIAWPTDVHRPDDLDSIVGWDAAELSVAIRRRTVSCVEVMTAFLDHIDRVNPQVNAIVSLRPREELLTEATTKDAKLERGEYDGWMHGFPHAVKDLADVRGLPTTLGLIRPSWGLPDPVDDSLFVARIRAAGAIFIGKTNTPELGLGSHTFNDVFGTTLNAYDQTRTAGGSSGGAAVSVALRMLPVADGSDFMGSLRNPTGWNNVFGLRPSFGRVPAGGEQFVDQGGVNGPVARTALDLALLLRTMSGYDAHAPLSVEQGPESLTTLPGHPDQAVRGRTVAWLGDLGGYLPMESDVLDVTTEALGHFADLGMTVTALDGLPRTPAFNGNEDLWPTWLTYRHWLAGMSVKDAYDAGWGDAMKPEAAYEYEGLVGTDDSAPISAVEVFENASRRSELYDAFRELFEIYDYAVLPTAQVMPFDAQARWPSSIAGTEMSSYHRWMEVTTIGTLIGAPVLAMPAGFSRAGLPIGLQVIGPNHSEHSLLELARAWEEQTGFVQQSPPPLLTAGAGDDR